MTHADDVRAFSPSSSAAENMTCQLLIAGGGLSELSAAEAAMQQGLDVIVIEKSVFGQQAASGLNAGQFLTGWAKPVPTMLAELAEQERERGLRGEQAQAQAQRRVRAFLRRTVEGCQRLLALDHAYNLRASVHRGVAIAAAGGPDVGSLKASYDFMKNSNFSAMMPPAQVSRRPFYQFSTPASSRSAAAPPKPYMPAGLSISSAAAFARETATRIGAIPAQARRALLSEYRSSGARLLDDHMTIFCGSGAAIRANALFMANAYARHINGDIHERTIFTYNYVVEVELRDGANVLTAEKVLSDTRDPCFYARRYGRRLYMGYEETAETSPEITHGVARRTLEEGQKVFPALRTLTEHDIRDAWSGAIYYTLDDYPFVERRHGGRVITFAAPSDHGNSLATRVGQLVGNFVAASILGSRSAEDNRRRRREARRLRLFEGFPKGLRLRPGMRYQEAAFPGPPTPPSTGS